MTKRQLAMALAMTAWCTAGATAQTSPVRDPRWAVVVSGASGGAAYAEQMARWRREIAEALKARFGFVAGQIVELVDETARASGTAATADNVRKAFTTLRGQMGKDDVALVVLLGHGTYDGDQAKFNLVGPDLTAGEWAVMLGTLPGRVVVVNTTESSAPFIEALAAKGRVVITATDTGAQKYATVFPEYFAKALADANADLDKDGKTSIWEVFAATSGSVARHYTERAQLTTERAVLSDTGEKVGVLATAAGQQGTLARSLYLDRDVAAESASPEVQTLIARRRALEADAQAHIQKKATADPAAWSAEFERLMIELARVSREIRQRS